MLAWKLNQDDGKASIMESKSIIMSLALYATIVAARIEIESV